MTHRSPKVHRDPPTRPPQLVDDGYLVEPELVDPRVPYHGWHPSSKPVRHDFAVFGLGICVGIVAFALLITIARQVDLAAPSPAPHPTTGLPRDLSGLLADASGARQGGAPHGLMVTGGAPSPRSEAPVLSPTGDILGGYATWYDTCSSCAAAGPDLRAMLGRSWRGTVVTVEGPASASVTVALTDACWCRDRHGQPTVLDLSAEAFAELAPLSWGVVAVSIEIPAQLPATDTRETR